METVYIVLIISAAIVILFIGWIYRDRLIEGLFRGGKSGVEAHIKASDRPKESSDGQGASPPSGVVISGNLSGANIQRVAGRDIVSGDSTSSDTQSPGVSIVGSSLDDATISDVAGRDIRTANDSRPETT